MKKENSYNSLFYRGVISILVIVVLMLIFSSKDNVVYSMSQLISNTIQASAVVILVFVTWFYARQTQKQAEFSKSLLNEQKLKRDLEFNERRLRDFYNPFLESLIETMKNFGEKKIKEIKDFMDEPKRKIYWPYYYMFQEDTRKIIDMFYMNIDLLVVQETDNVLEENSKSELLFAFAEVRDILHKERTKIEDYISTNYPFPEIEINKEGKS